MKRRSFLSYAVGMLSAVGLAAQQSGTGLIEKGKAVVCPTQGTIKCPNGHETCRTIDAPIIIGNDNSSYPDWAQVVSKHMIECDICHVLFIAS